MDIDRNEPPRSLFVNQGDFSKVGDGPSTPTIYPEPNHLNPNQIKPAKRMVWNGFWNKTGQNVLEENTKSGEAGSSSGFKLNWMKDLPLPGTDNPKKLYAAEHIQSVLTKAIARQREEGKPGELNSGVGRIIYERNNIDFNDYKPVQKFPLSERGLDIVTIRHGLANNVIGIRFGTRVVIYDLQKKAEDGSEFFTLEKIQEVSTMRPELFPQDVLGMTSAFSLNSITNLSSPVGKTLSYCFSIATYSGIFMVHQKVPGRSAFKPTLEPGCPDLFELKGHQLDVRHLAFDAEHGELLASVSDDFTCIVWNLNTRNIMAKIDLDSRGVACMWHPSDPFKLLIVEQEGKIRMFNTMKNCVVVTLNTLISPIFCADWSITNSLIVAIGSQKAVYFFDLSVLNSEPGRRVETQFGSTNYVKFSTTDNQTFATATCNPRGEIRTFQKSYVNHIWSQKRENIQSIEWIYGEPFLMALSQHDLLIYESAQLK